MAINSMHVSVYWQQYIKHAQQPCCPLAASRWKGNAALDNVTDI